MADSHEASQPHIVVVGAGFGGLELVRSLKRAPVRITLIDRRNFHLFQPLLYQVATGGLSPANLATPIRAITRKQKNCRVLLETVREIDPERQTLTLEDSELQYDHLVLAVGSQYTYFGNDHWRLLAPGLKSIEDATTIRRRVLSAFEVAETETDPERRRGWMTFVIVGGGPTGVELAGAVSELARYTLRKDFRAIDPADARVILIDAGSRVLSQFPEKLSKKARRELEEHHEVEVIVGRRVDDITPEQVEIVDLDGNNRQIIPTHTVMWAAGVEASPLTRQLAEITETETDRMGRIIVDPDLSLPNYPNIYAVGDCAHFAHDLAMPLPCLAPVAIQQGEYLADRFEDLTEEEPGETPKPFRYRDYGTMATVGRSFAVVEMGKLKFAGFFAWMAWLFVHLLQLVKFENRLLVLFQWAWNYTTRNRSARLITGVEGLPTERMVDQAEPVHDLLDVDDENESKSSPEPFDDESEPLVPATSEGDTETSPMTQPPPKK